MRIPVFILYQEDDRVVWKGMLHALPHEKEVIVLKRPSSSPVAEIGTTQEFFVERIEHILALDSIETRLGYLTEVKIFVSLVDD
jgi:hypothetical protein